jgi:two-component system sensor histidine kinase SenX3
MGRNAKRKGNEAGPPTCGASCPVAFAGLVALHERRDPASTLPGDMGNVLIGVLIGALTVGAAALAAHLRSSNRATRLAADVERAESLLRDSQRTSRSERQVQDLILESMEEGVLLFDRRERTVFANAAAESHLGATPTDAGALLPIDLQKAARRAGYTGAVVRVSVETGAPSRWLRATAMPVGDDGSVLMVIGDVTEARRIDEVRRDFVANASHELKTPAAAIQAAAETIRSAANDDLEAVPRFARQLELDAHRLSRIVADLLDLSRLEAGSDLSEGLRLQTVVREEAQRFREPAAQAGLTLTVDAPDVPAVRGSARDLSLLVRNLIDNAIRYTKRGGLVSVRIAAAEDHVRLTVSDEGVGIPSRDLPRVFERFYRVDRARSRDTGGTGLGLSIVKHVTENHGGTVQVASELGRGTTFEVRLPTLVGQGDRTRARNG